MDEFKLDIGDVDITKLESPLMSQNSYAQAHAGLVIPCHDIFVKYNDGILLVNRTKNPAKHFTWCLGGRIMRGMPIEESLRLIVSKEAGLNLNMKTIQELGTARTYFNTDPFEHGRGTDTINFVYVAEARGNIRLDRNHNLPFVVKYKTYKKLGFRGKLHPYIRKYLDIIFEIQSKNE